MELNQDYSNFGCFLKLSRKIQDTGMDGKKEMIMIQK